MSAIDKFKNKAEEVLGEAKEKLGEVTNNDELKTKGQKDQAGAEVKDAAESAKHRLTD